MKVELHIERLVVEGVSRAEGRALGAAVERELGRLIAERGLPERLRASGAVARIDAGSVERARSGDGADLGARVAGSVYRGMRS